MWLQFSYKVTMCQEKTETVIYVFLIEEFTSTPNQIKEQKE